MALRRILAGGAWLMLAGALISRMDAQDPGRPCSDSAMPFDLVANFEIVVPGQLGELNGLRFILDTGSSYSTIDRRVADRLGLRRRPGSVFNFDRNLVVEWTDVSEVRVGPMRVAGVSMMVASLAGLSQFVGNADGIIGLDMLSRARKICIDYRQRRISFTLDEERAGPPAVVKAFVVPVTIQGISMRLLVDTGFEYLLVYYDRLRSALPHMHTEGEPRKAVLGNLQAVQVNLPGVGIADRYGVTPVLLIEGPKAGLDGVDGYLGPAALHARRVELDFAARTMRWQ